MTKNMLDISLKNNEVVINLKIKEQGFVESKLFQNNQ